MNTRIKQLRKELGLNQAEFGACIKTKQTTIAGYETGIRTPRDATIAAICRAFKVNETWLRTGIGEMFVLRSEDEEFQIILDEIGHSDDEFAMSVIRAYWRLKPEEKEVIKKLVAQFNVEPLHDKA